MTADEWLDDGYRLEQRDKRIALLASLCLRAADALEYENFVLELDEIVARKAFAAELRKAAG